MKVRDERGRWDDERQDAGIREEREGALGEKGRRQQTPRLDTQETRKDLGSGHRHERDGDKEEDRDAGQPRKKSGKAMRREKHARTGQGAIEQQDTGPTLRGRYKSTQCGVNPSVKAQSSCPNPQVPKAASSPGRHGFQNHEEHLMPGT